MDPTAREAAEKVIGLRFNDPDLLGLALQHASFSDSRIDSNERLEFLGDAVLGLVVCARIFERYPDLLEGEMTKIKSSAVSRRTCAQIAKETGMIDLLVIGKGMAEQPKLPSSLAAAVVESVVGAIYMDRGFEACRDFLLPLLDPYIEEAFESGHQQNYKSLLQQHAQQTFGEPPAYRVLDEKGPDHAKAFKVAVEVSGKRFEAAWAATKKAAEQHAARIALVAMGVVDADEDSTAPAGSGA
ncbi:MAG: ribonuclease III [Planctomycetota bacterium]